MDVEHLRSKLLKIIIDFLGGDEIAAEYLLCHLVSCVDLRHDMMVVGKFPLNMFGPEVNQNFVSELEILLYNLAFKPFCLALSLSDLNSETDYNTYLECLQLSRAHLIVDETEIQVEQLNENGLRNVEAVQSLIDRQENGYLIVSKEKSVLESACALKLEPTNHALDAAANEPTVFGQYLTAACVATYSIPPEIKKQIESHFLSSRKSGQNMTVQNLHATLLLARLLSISKGKDKLELEVWERAQMMEEMRNSRLSKLE